MKGGRQFVPKIFCPLVVLPRHERLPPSPLFASRKTIVPDVPPVDLGLVPHKGRGRARTTQVSKETDESLVKDDERDWGKDL